MESGDNELVVFKDGVEIGSRHGRSIGKYVKGGVNIIIDDTVSWCFNRGFDPELCIGFDVYVNVSKVEALWRLMAV